MAVLGSSLEFSAWLWQWVRLGNCWVWVAGVRAGEAGAPGAVWVLMLGERQERQAGSHLGCVIYSPRCESHQHRAMIPPLSCIMPQAWETYWGSTGEATESSKSWLSMYTHVGKDRIELPRAPHTEGSLGERDPGSDTKHGISIHLGCELNPSQTFPTSLFELMSSHCPLPSQPWVTLQTLSYSNGF